MTERRQLYKKLRKKLYLMLLSDENMKSPKIRHIHDSDAGSYVIVHGLYMNKPFVTSHIIRPNFDNSDLKKIMTLCINHKSSDEQDTDPYDFT